ncbi:hypothetical protein R1sor_017926 [Riccia sorocarpa]|uniref:Reverse transcriptase n=1 Tax=Riccia sorocarpa TaxID=122646 RepID=A0ABD3IEG6_9MARC
MRTEHGENLSEEHKARLAHIEDQLRKQEHQDARAWRLRSKQRWLREGEAPSRYFFAQMKAKFTNETMPTLTLEDGTKTEDRAVFNTTMDTLRKFELASGAKLNLSKTTIIPVGDGTIPAWLQNSGCTIATPSDRYRYLGLLTGVDVMEQETLDDLKLKLSKRLQHWSARLLSWPERVILAHNVLRALPNYTLMTVGLSPHGLKPLDSVTRDFL